MPFDDSTRWLAREQLGVLSRNQLLEGGSSPDAIRWRLARHWRVLVPGVYQLDRRPTTRAQREMAGLLAAGPLATLGGLSAARWWGITAADPGDRVQVLVRPPRRSRRLAWLDIARSSVDDPGVTIRGQLRVSGGAQATLDAAVQSRSAERAAAIGIEAVQRRVTTIDDLVDALGRRNRRHSALARVAVNAAATGAWSRPEAALLAGLAGSRVLPEMWPNPVLSVCGRPLVSPDGWLDDVALAVMVHSREFHSGAEDWDSTVERDSQLVTAGVMVLGVTPNRIYRDLPSVVRRVELAYAAAQRRPRPPVVAKRRSLFAS